MVHVCKTAMYSGGMYMYTILLVMVMIDTYGLPSLTCLNVIICLLQPEGGLPVVCLQRPFEVLTAGLACKLQSVI